MLTIRLFDVSVIVWVCACAFLLISLSRSLTIAEGFPVNPVSIRSGSSLEMSHKCISTRFLRNHKNIHLSTSFILFIWQSRLRRFYFQSIKRSNRCASFVDRWMNGVWICDWIYECTNGPVNRSMKQWISWSFAAPFKCLVMFCSFFDMNLFFL